MERSYAQSPTSTSIQSNPTTQSMEIEQGSVVVFKLQADPTMDGSIDDNSSSHKSKKQKMEEDLEEDPDFYYDSSDCDKEEEEDKEEETEHRGEKEKEDAHEEGQLKKEIFMLYLIHNPDRYPEAYSHLLHMSNIAVQDYNKKSSTGFVISGIKKANFAILSGVYYQLTFTAACGVTKQTFLAKLWYDPIDVTIEVMSCDIKLLDDDKILGEQQQEEEPSHKSNEILGEQEPSHESNEISDPVQRIKSLMERSDDELLAKIKNYFDPDEDQHMLLKQVRKYFQSVVESEGFTCRYFPGHIPGISDFKPRKKIIINMNRHVEGYSRLKVMANLAVSHYINENDTGHEYMASRVINANMWKESSRSYVYYITFRAEKDYRYFPFGERMPISFEAKVRDKQLDIDVLFCRKLNH